MLWQALFSAKVVAGGHGCIGLRNGPERLLHTVMTTQTTHTPILLSFCTIILYLKGWKIRLVLHVSGVENTLTAQCSELMLRALNEALPC